MTAAHAPAGRDQRSLAWLQPYLLVLALWAACLGGLVVARMVQDAGSHATTRHGASAQDRAGTALIGPPVPGDVHLTRAHFGTIGTTAATFVHGTSARALGGQAHGIKDYVPPSRQLVQVPVTFHNESTDSVPLEPSWFRLVGARTMTPVSSSLRAGTLRAGATVDGTIAFNAPRDGHRLRLEFREPGRAKLRIELGATGPRYLPRPGDTAVHKAHR